MARPARIAAAVNLLAAAALAAALGSGTKVSAPPPTATSPAGAARWQAGIKASATPAPDLQQQFEVLPQGGHPGWLGADSDVSIVIGGTSGRRALWIFADTYISGFNKAQDQREWAGKQMPHSTIALVDCDTNTTTSGGGRPCTAPPKFYWREGAESGRAESFWVLPPLALGPPPGTPEPLIWPVAGLASRDGKTVLLLAQRIVGFLNCVGATTIVVNTVDKPDPLTDWSYTTAPIPSHNGTLAWFSAVSFASDDPANSTVFLFGHDSTLPGRQTLLAKADFGQLLRHDWSGLAFWTNLGWSGPGALYRPDAMQPLAVPSWETTLQFSAGLQRWYTFNLGLDGTVSLWTADEVVGEWAATAVYKLPPPFAHPASGAWLCYAAKSHPELALPDTAGRGVRPATSATVELVFSYICNTWGNATVTEAQEFQPGGMAFSRRGVLAVVHQGAGVTSAECS